jgi:hypothetical protein
MRVILRIAVMDVAEEGLANALVAMVGGTWPSMTAAQVLQHLT